MSRKHRMPLRYHAPRPMDADDCYSVRRALGLSLDELAGLVGAPRASLVRWERNGCSRPPVVLAALRAALVRGCLPELDPEVSYWRALAGLFRRLADEDEDPAALGPEEEARALGYLLGLSRHGGQLTPARISARLHDVIRRWTRQGEEEATLETAAREGYSQGLAASGFLRLPRPGTPPRRSLPN